METTSTVTAGIDPAVLLASPPTTIGRFAVAGEIGRGANGVVYAAHDPVLGRDVAIKAIPLTVNDKVRARAETNFIKEARAVAGLNHPHIVTVFDAGRTDTLAYIAMERLRGRDLHEYLHSGARLSLRQAAALMARIADAVHYAHKRGLIHRDIKPSNIFLSRDMKPKVLDFGVALPRGEQGSSQRTRLIGTPNYMSPEQAQGIALDARSDVFSLGAILYEMVTGKRAFDAPTTDELLTLLVGEEPTPVAELRPETPPELARIIAKAMAKDIEARYQTAGELRNDLAAFAGNREFDGVLLQAHEAGKAGSRRHRVLWPAVIAVAGLAAAGSLWLALQDETDAPVPPSAIAPPAASPSPLPSAIPAPTEHAAPAPNQPVRAAPPPADGKVMLAVAPWGEVLVNGEIRGVSPPLTEMRLPPGSYAIEVRNGDFPPLKANIEVRAGQAQTLKHRF
jgi:eukaryotic-like serine/threonine-protein kinase